MNSLGKSNIPNGISKLICALTIKNVSLVAVVGGVGHALANHLEAMDTSYYDVHHEEVPEQDTAAVSLSNQ